MKKYSVEWKAAQQKKNGGWPQKHNSEKWGHFWKWHYIRCDTEYSTGEHITRAECISGN